MFKMKFKTKDLFKLLLIRYLQSLRTIDKMEVKLIKKIDKMKSLNIP